MTDFSTIDRPLRRNIFWAFFANGAAAFLSWLMLVVLTKVAGVSEVGLFSLAQAVALPIHTFFTFKLRIVQSTDHTAEFSEDEYRNFRILSAILNILTTAALALLLYRGRTYVLIIILSLGYSVIIYREFYVSVLQKHERNDIISLSTVIQGFFGLAFFIAGYLATRDLRVGVAGIFLSRLLSVIFVDRRLSRPFGYWGSRSLLKDLKESVSRRRFAGLFRIGFPMGGVALLSTLFASIPRLVLDKSVNTEAVGFYSALLSLVIVMSMFINSLGQSLTPRLALQFRNDIRIYKKSLLRIFIYAGIFVAFCLLAFWFYGRMILTILFTKEYSYYFPAFIKLTVGGGVMVFFSVMLIALSAQRAFKVQFHIYLVLTIVMLATSLVLIPKYGIDGAAISYGVSNIAGILISIIYYRRNMEARNG